MVYENRTAGIGDAHSAGGGDGPIRSDSGGNVIDRGAATVDVNANIAAAPRSTCRGFGGREKPDRENGSQRAG